ncbi:hypothetical protein [Bailinhaonella thermotolerans]|uniref:Uncharacterized protein n=1 Tax=Bailinhaonella thermotolerans TaxID=1070861 RepID=A0A3A4A907_9ACTN|nr:hypothetical protein [Bailinhaonella thermotolerans]RJL24499.1 hypothetical protein D5H75_29730 [Bailinhaonella thermotolerans]
MDPKLVREMLREIKQAAGDMRSLEGRITQMLGSAGVSARTSHRPGQVAEQANGLIADVTARLSVLEKEERQRLAQRGAPGDLAGGEGGQGGSGSGATPRQPADDALPKQPPRSDDVSGGAKASERESGQGGSDRSGGGASRGPGDDPPRAPERPRDETPGRPGEGSPGDPGKPGGQQPERPNDEVPRQPGGGNPQVPEKPGDGVCDNTPGTPGQPREDAPRAPDRPEGGAQLPERPRGETPSEPGTPGNPSPPRHEVPGGGGIAGPGGCDLPSGQNPAQPPQSPAQPPQSPAPPQGGTPAPGPQPGEPRPMEPAPANPPAGAPNPYGQVPDQPPGGQPRADQPPPEQPPKGQPPAEQGPRGQGVDHLPPGSRRIDVDGDGDFDVLQIPLKPVTPEELLDKFQNPPPNAQPREMPGVTVPKGEWGTGEWVPREPTPDGPPGQIEPNPPAKPIEPPPGIPDQIPPADDSGGGGAGPRPGAVTAASYDPAPSSDAGPAREPYTPAAYGGNGDHRFGVTLPPGTEGFGRELPPYDLPGQAEPHPPRSGGPHVEPMTGREPYGEPMTGREPYGDAMAGREPYGDPRGGPEAYGEARGGREPYAPEAYGQGRDDRFGVSLPPGTEGFGRELPPYDLPGQAEPHPPRSGGPHVEPMNDGEEGRS